MQFLAHAPFCTMISKGRDDQLDIDCPNSQRLGADAMRHVLVNCKSLQCYQKQLKFTKDYQQSSMKLTRARRLSK